MNDTYQDHPLRNTLADEVHARPFINITSPQNFSHFVMVRDGGSGRDDLDHLRELCILLEHPTLCDTNSALLDFGDFNLRWERHGEFSSWTFFAPAMDRELFLQRCLDRVPKAWLYGLPGLRLAAVNLALVNDERHRTRAEVNILFREGALVGSQVAMGAAELWTDFRTHDDGFGRILIQDKGLHPRQAGRLVQRVLEIETYRMMAMLGFPVAQSAALELKLVERELADIMPTIQTAADTDEETALLARLINLATEIERITSKCDFRFGATKAYQTLIQHRIGELRESKIEGFQTVDAFFERRLGPAMRTCEATSERLKSIGGRLARCSELLQTRVGIYREVQNHRILNSMDRRASIQLGMQATVEGLSTAAISYYAVGLLVYFSNGIVEAGVPVNMTVVIGLATPAIFLTVWFAVRRIRNRIMKQTTRSERASNAASLDGDSK